MSVQNPTAIVIYPGVDTSAGAYLNPQIGYLNPNPPNSGAVPAIPSPGNIKQPLSKIFTTAASATNYNIFPDTTVFETVEFVNNAAGTPAGTYTIYVVDTSDYAAPGTFVAVKTLAPGDPPWSWDCKEDQRWNGRSFQISSNTAGANSLQIIYS